MARILQESIFDCGAHANAQASLYQTQRYDFTYLENEVAIVPGGLVGRVWHHRELASFPQPPGAGGDTCLSR
jgi:hypothetical protein